MLRTILSAFFLIFLVSCGSSDKEIKVPRHLIQPDEMVSILVDFHLCEAALVEDQTKGRDMNLFTNHYYNTILQKHNISRKKMLTSLQFYTANMKLLQKVYEEVVTELNTMESEVMSR